MDQPTVEPFITPTLLASTGVSIPDDEVGPLLDYLNDILEERIGEEIVETLDDEELEELAQLQESGTEEELDTWLKENVIELEEIVEEEVAILLGETTKHHKAFSSQS